MKRSLLFAIVLVSMMAMPARPDDFGGIQAVLDKQVAAWNRGDIEGYMAGYMNSPDTMFVGTEVTRGWTNVRDRYKAKYTSRAKMGTLSFSDIDFRPMNQHEVVVTGAWKLSRAADTPHGRFTLIFQRIPHGAGWKIVYDHSS